MPPPHKKVKQQHTPTYTPPRPVQSPLALLLNIPRELRDIIYTQYDLDWNAINPSMAKFDRVASGLIDSSGAPVHWKNNKYQVHLKSLSTPELLLICHQITEETLEILRSKPLIVGPPMGPVPKYSSLWPLQITAFISGPTLRHVRHLVLHPDARCQQWYKFVESAMHPAPVTLLDTVVFPIDSDPDDISGCYGLTEDQVDDLHQWLWGLRNALKTSTALRSLTINFQGKYAFGARKCYYQQVVS